MPHEFLGQLGVSWPDFAWPFHQPQGFLALLPGSPGQLHVGHRQAQPVHRFAKRFGRLHPPLQSVGLDQGVALIKVRTASRKRT